MANTIDKKLSIVIPCYNHGHYLPAAIQSCFDLGYGNLEIIVVDDGSTDNTPEVVANFPQVRYHYKQNEGLPAARNTGIDLATGEYISFLDSDDWYYPEKLIENLEILEAHPEAALIYGCHDIVRGNGSVYYFCRNCGKDPYLTLLTQNLIAHPASVIYRTKIAREIRFDTSKELKGLEDYDHYLSIARKYNILHNPVNVSAYRKHDANMSNNLAMMLNSVMNVLYKHRKELRTREERQAWRTGMARWQKFYGFFPIPKQGFEMTPYHWQLVKKYNIIFPLKLMQRFKLILGKRLYRKLNRSGKK